MIEFSEITKAFGSLRANDGVSFAVRRGTLHGIVGENGAGKSTAMKLLYGQLSPDSGELRIDGVARKWGSPRDAIAAGIGMVHQHFMLAETETALDNVLLGARGGGFAGLRPLRRREARAKLEALCRQYHFEVDWDAPVHSLPVGVQQRIEILKLLYLDARVLILDEPTAVLTPQETDELFLNLRRLCAEGRTVLVITHKLREVLRFTDAITVFRAGKVTANLPSSEATAGQLAEAMVGRKVSLTANLVAPSVSAASSPVVVEARGLSVRSARTSSGRVALEGIDFEVRSGEIVGVAGVDGNGQSELIQALLGVLPEDVRIEGRVILGGEDVQGAATSAIRDRGVAVIPEDRHREGLLLGEDLATNFALGLQRNGDFSSRGFMVPAVLESETRRGIESLDVRPADPAAIARGLSGGNQQKLIVARELRRKARLLIAAQPTRGVDVGAIELIHARIIEQARVQGAGVLLISSELDELMDLSDRLLVLYKGRIAARIERSGYGAGIQAFDERAIGLAMSGEAPHA